MGETVGTSYRGRTQEVRHGETVPTGEVGWGRGTGRTTEVSNGCHGPPSLGGQSPRGGLLGLPSRRSATPHAHGPVGPAVGEGGACGVSGPILGRRVPRPCDALRGSRVEVLP